MQALQRRQSLAAIATCCLLLRPTCPADRCSAWRLQASLGNLQPTQYIRRRTGMQLTSLATVLLLALAAVALPRPARAAGEEQPLLAPDAYLNVVGKPLLMPINRTTEGRAWYFEVPKNPGGCTRTARRLGAG